MKLLNLPSLLKAREPTSIDLRAALAELDIPAKGGAVEKAKAYRRQLLLDDQVRSSALDEADRNLAQAQREHDRAVAFDEELRARLAQAEERERLEALMARIAAAENEQAAIAKLADAEVPRMLETLASLARRAAASHIECDQADAALIAAGSTDRVKRSSPKIRLPGEAQVHLLTAGPQPSGYEQVIQ